MSNPEDSTDANPTPPPAARLIAAHMLANVLIQGTWYAVSAMMPVLARKRFDASDWQTVMVTAAMPTLMLLSIFWGDLLRRCTLRNYLLINWAASMLPLACGALAQNFWQLLAAHVVAAAGASGWSPVAGDLLKGFYQDKVRGRALGLVSSAMFAGWMLMSFSIGKALDHNENIFRLYLPATAVSYLLGMLILRHLVKRTGIDRERRAAFDHHRHPALEHARQPTPDAQGAAAFRTRRVSECPPVKSGSVSEAFGTRRVSERPPSSPLPLGEGSGVRAFGEAETPGSENFDGICSSLDETKTGSVAKRQTVSRESLRSSANPRPLTPTLSQGERENDAPQAYGAVPPGPTGTPLPLPATHDQKPLGLRRLLDPIIHARAILKADRSFARYEAAFMTYGIGWMICAALIPVLATDRLHMKYTEFASSTQVIYTLCMLLMTYPMGHLMDRIGAVRTSGLSFLWLTMYPLALIFAYSVPAVAVSTIIYGIAMAGVNIGWMLGPVALAPSREKVSQYVAIHTSLVGLRGTIGQFLGMLVYTLTNSFTWSFTIAAVSFLWAAYQMWQLHGRLPSPSPLGRGAG